MSKRQKGNKRERQAESLYNHAGYKTEICRGLRWGRTDWYGLFDGMAVKPGRKVRYFQVKSNQVDKVDEWIRQARAFCDPEYVELDYLVCHDYQGWRLLGEADTEKGYEVVYDERDTKANMGEDMKAWMRENL